jgi:hypothetical protein
MKLTDFYRAIEIITAHHSNELQINRCKENQQVSPILSSPTIHITKCCASVVDKLVTEGFSLSADNGGLNVDKY